MVAKFWGVHYFHIIKPTRCNISQIYFGIEIYLFQTGFLSTIRSLILYTQQQIYVTEVMFHPDPASKQSAKPVWHIPIAVYTVLDPWWWGVNLSETGRFLYQNKFEKLVHLVIRLYHDARSSECQSFHSSITENSCFLGFDTTLLGDWSLVIRMNVHLHSEGSSWPWITPSKHQEAVTQWRSVTYRKARILNTIANYNLGTSNENTLNLTEETK